MAVTSPVDIVLEKWKRCGIRLFPPEEEATVIATLSKVGRLISCDVVNLYCATGGMEDGEMDSLWSLWSFDRVLSMNSDYERSYILFADYSIDAYFYCFKYESIETSSVHVDYFNGKEPQRVANSVNEFFSLYLTAPERLEMMT
ncbi:MAG: hypothetical protein H0V27_12485 [Pyrinomonadaceae bacterium]|jgi:hypothetical protein|nr:hypothetical protein [Pyrinomonadaceae bacterium]